MKRGGIYKITRVSRKGQEGLLKVLVTGGVS